MVRFPPSQTLPSLPAHASLPPHLHTMALTTRASNAEKQPGKVDAPKRRRSKAQVTADKAKAEQTAKSKEEKDAKSKQNIARLEQQIASGQERMRQTRVKNNDGTFRRSSPSRERVVTEYFQKTSPPRAKEKERSQLSPTKKSRQLSLRNPSWNPRLDLSRARGQSLC